MAVRRSNTFRGAETQEKLRCNRPGSTAPARKDAASTKSSDIFTGVTIVLLKAPLPSAIPEPESLP